MNLSKEQQRRIQNLIAKCKKQNNDNLDIYEVMDTYKCYLNATDEVRDYIYNLVVEGMKHKPTIYGYIRVSTRSQLEGKGLDVQREAILSKYVNAKIVEEQFTGKTTQRPKFQELIGDLKKGDTLVVHKLDRFARTTIEGMKLMEDLQKKGITVEVLSFGKVEGGFTSNHKLMMQIMLAFAEYERDMIVERTQAGKAMARANAEAIGEKFKEGRPKVHKDKQKEHAMELLNSGKTYREVEELTGMSKSTLIRYKRKVEAEKVMEV